MIASRRADLYDHLRQLDEQTRDARADRCLQLDHHGIVGNHYFAEASSECITLYRDGHFIAAVMLTQAVNEAIIKFLVERNSIIEEKHDAQIGMLAEKNILTPPAIEASEKIWKSFRNDVHHMNPQVGNIDFNTLAKRNLQNLAIVEGEVFEVEISQGKLIPKHPQYWKILKDGTVSVFLRLGL